MGRYKTDRIYWGNKYYSPEELISWGFGCAPKHSDVTMDIAAHIFREAFLLQDDNLFQAGEDLMGAAGSPRNFVASESSKQATANNNRPYESPAPELPPALCDMDKMEDENWDDSFDGVFTAGINPQKVFSELEKKDDPRVTDFYPRFFVFFRVLLFLGWIENHQKHFLEWANHHWECGWKKPHNFKFGNNIQKELRDADMSTWNDKTCNGSDIGVAYRNLAKGVLELFSEKTDDNKIKDRVDFYKDSEACLINNGDNLDYPF